MNLSEGYRETLKNRETERETERLKKNRETDRETERLKKEKQRETERHTGNNREGQTDEYEDCTLKIDFFS